MISSSGWRAATSLHAHALAAKNSIQIAAPAIVANQAIEIRKSTSSRFISPPCRRDDSIRR
jgi:hypothetical protein